MDRISEIQAFIARNNEIREELADLMTKSLYKYSRGLAEDIIEQQQELKREASRLSVIALQYESYEDIYEVHMRYETFCSFVNLEECEVAQWKSKDGSDYVKYSLKIDKLILFAIKNISEEHKNAQAI